MIDPIYIPLLSGFFGALIGAGASIITVIVQARAETRRQRYQITLKYAFDEWDAGRKYVQDGGAIRLMPLSAFLHFHLETAKAIEENDFTPERMEKIHRLNHEMMDTLIKLNVEWQKRPAK